MNNANPSVRIDQNPKGLRYGRKRTTPCPQSGHSNRSDRGEIGGSSPKACEFLLKERLVLLPLLLAGLDVQLIDYLALGHHVALSR